MDLLDGSTGWTGLYLLAWTYWMDLLNGSTGWIYWMDLLDGSTGWIYWMDLLDGSTEWVYLDFGMDYYI